MKNYLIEDIIAARCAYIGRNRMKLKPSSCMCILLINVMMIGFLQPNMSAYIERANGFSFGGFYERKIEVLRSNYQQQNRTHI